VSRNGHKPVLKFRYRKPGKVFGVKFSFSRNGGRKLKGRILSVRKVSREQLDRVHEFLPFNPEALLREFREKESREVANNGKKESN